MEQYVNLVTILNISDSAFTASSEYEGSSNPTAHGAHRVRTDRYFDYSCAWVANNPHDQNPWVKIDMGQLVTVWAVEVRARCDYPSQRVTSFNLKTSDDNATWTNASGTITAHYNTNDISVTWLPQPRRGGGCWKITVLLFEEYPSMKAELIGKGKNE